MKHFEKPLFFLFVLSIPLLFGKHFWPSYSFVNGIRVDYISPTLYVSDVLFALLFLFSISHLFKPLLSQIKKPLVLFAIISFVLSTLFARVNILSILGILKLFECFYIGFYICQTYGRNVRGKFTLFLTIGALLETGIIFSQFFYQHSIGGILYFFGERTFSVSTPAIATFQMNGSQILRGYGTFPHPNVAAFYLFVCFVFLLSYGAKTTHLKILKTFALILIFLGIIVTFSRIIILLVVGSIVIESILVNRRKKGKKAVVTVGLVITFILIGLLLLPRFMHGIIRDWLLRVQLLNIFLHIFLNHVITGVGFNNYFFYESPFQKAVSPILLQPVHNIYLLWVVQTGFLGAALLIAFARKLFGRAKFLIKSVGRNNSIKLPVLILLVSSLFVGLFDHYLLTLQQGQLLLAIILGFVFVREKY